MDYFLLNVNRDNINYVDEWIKNKKIAPIFYGKSTINEIVNQKDAFPPDAYHFIDNFSKININAIIFSIGNSNIYIYKQKTILKEYDEFRNIINGDLVKGIEIELLKEVEIKKCPLVLITIKSNRYMSSGAFRKIDELKGKSYFGNIKALEYLLYNKKPEIKSFEDYLFCLSSLEFETLIAKIYEENKFYVPAYKGGFIKNYDLFCRNGDDIKSIQIKLNLKKKDYNQFTDLYYCINSELKKDNIKTWEDIENEIKKCNETRKWLKQTLEWWVNYKGEL